MEQYLKELISDLKVGSMKIHALHVIMEGESFLSYHAFLGDIYDFLESKTDEMMERMRQLGFCPPLTLKEQLELAGIKEESEEICDIVEQGVIVSKTLAFLDDELQDGIIKSGEAEDYVTQNILIDYKQAIGVYIWKNKSIFGIKEEKEEEDEE